MRKLTRGVVAVSSSCIAIALGGCYRYASPEAGTLPDRGHVRVALTEAGIAALAPMVGTSVNGLEGSVVRQSGDTLVVRADRLLTTANVDVTWSGSDIALPSAWRDGVRRRELAVGRTAAITAGGVALAAVVVAVIRRAGDSGGDSGTGGDPIRVRRGRP